MHADTDTGADVTARALAAVEAARKRAIWADDFVTLNKDRRDRTRMEMREIRADLATDSTRAELALLVADVPLLAAIAAAGLALRKACTTTYDGLDWCTACGADALAGIGHADDCAAVAFDAVVARVAGEEPTS